MTRPARVLVTGASGFVGRALVAALHSAGIAVTAALRAPRDAVDGVRDVVVGEIDTDTNWREALAGADVVVHLAARVHQKRDTSSEPLRQFRAVNRDATASLAEQAATAGIARLVFVSSVKVHGDATLPGKPYTETDVPSPVDPYGVSKLEGEDAVRRVTSRASMDHVIIRPPLVYGPGVRANFLSMTRWLARGVPLPLGAIVDNRRSLVALDNLVSFIAGVLTHPLASNETYLVSDGDDVSTTELLRRTARALGVAPRLLHVSPRILLAGASAIGQRDVARRLCGSLQVDSNKARRSLGWTPAITLDEGLKRTVAWPYSG